MAGYEVVGLAYPCGGVNYDDRVVDIIKKHTEIKYARTNGKRDSFEVPTDLFRVKGNVHHVMQGNRLIEAGKRFIDSKTNEPQVFYVYGHSFELDFGNEYWTKLEDFFEYISNRKDVFYGTNKDVLL